MAERGRQITLVTRGRRPVPKGYSTLVADRYDKASFAEAIKSWRGDAAIDFICFNKAQGEIAYEALKGKVGQYIFISTAAVYYKRPSTPLPMTETTPRWARYWDYSRLKAECEDWFAAVHGPDFPATIVRPSHTLAAGEIPGPFGGSDWTLAARILAGRPFVLPGDGQSLWTITAACDFAQGLAGLVGNPAAIGETFHITSDAALTWNGIFQEVGQAVGREPKIVHVPLEFICREYPQFLGALLDDKGQHSIFDNAKIKRFVPEFECVKSPRRLLRDAAAWRLADPARQTINAAADRIHDRSPSSWQ
ncbi:MAG: NAD-dependent epimerase/dehydratase family protein [Candidatus Sumerlaeota bacterium]|nr:NAD-dependent epimerase/dehydratase family protein [Candidatus Sumerlaeota bacterium]